MQIIFFGSEIIIERNPRSNSYNSIIQMEQIVQVDIEGILCHSTETIICIDHKQSSLVVLF